jgi:hypothetical protein
MQLPFNSPWSISIFNSLGRKLDEFAGYGERALISVIWDASRYPTGTYFYKAQIGDVSETKKMILAK